MLTNVKAGAIKCLKVLLFALKMIRWSGGRAHPPEAIAGVGTKPPPPVNFIIFFKIKAFLIQMFVQNHKFVSF